jgi:hypothetical protein
MNLNTKIYKTIICLHGCETWSLTLWEELILKVLENGVLRRMFEPKRKRVAGGWKRLHSKELHNLYNITKYY